MSSGATGAQFFGHLEVHLKIQWGVHHGLLTAVFFQHGSSYLGSSLLVFKNVFVQN